MTLNQEPQTPGKAIVSCDPYGPPGGGLLELAGWWSPNTLAFPYSMATSVSIHTGKATHPGASCGLADSPSGYWDPSEGSFKSLSPTSMGAVHMRGFGPAFSQIGMLWETPHVSDTHVGISSGV